MDAPSLQFLTLLKHLLSNIDLCSPLYNSVQANRRLAGEFCLLRCASTSGVIVIFLLQNGKRYCGDNLQTNGADFSVLVLCSCCRPSEIRLTNFFSFSWCGKCKHFIVSSIIAEPHNLFCLRIGFGLVLVKIQDFISYKTHCNWSSCKHDENKMLENHQFFLNCCFSS